MLYKCVYKINTENIKYVYVERKIFDDHYWIYQRWKVEAKHSEN